MHAKPTQDAHVGFRTRNPVVLSFWDSFHWLYGSTNKDQAGNLSNISSDGQFLQVRAIFPCTCLNLEGTLRRNGNVIFTSFGVPTSIVRQGQSVQV